LGKTNFRCLLYSVYSKKQTFSVFPFIPSNVSEWEELHGRGERLEEGGGGEADGRVYRREELKCNEN
jgi:hypothetical protein